MLSRCTRTRGTWKPRAVHRMQREFPRSNAQTCGCTTANFQPWKARHLMKDALSHRRSRSASQQGATGVEAHQKGAGDHCVSRGCSGDCAQRRGSAAHACERTLMSPTMQALDATQTSAVAEMLARATQAKVCRRKTTPTRQRRTRRQPTAEKRERINAPSD